MFEFEVTDGTNRFRTSDAIRTTGDPVAMGRSLVVRAGHDAAVAAAVFFRDADE